MDALLDNRPDHPVVQPPPKLATSEKLATFEKLADLFRCSPRPTVKVSSPDGTALTLPQEIFEVLNNVVEAMAAGQGVVIAPVNQRLTTQQAAELLGISRPTFVKLLQAGEIQYEQPGRHRRVRLTDVLDYRQRRSSERREALDRMVEIAEESGMYELTTHHPGKLR